MNEITNPHASPVSKDKTSDAIKASRSQIGISPLYYSLRYEVGKKTRLLQLIIVSLLALKDTVPDGSLAKSIVSFSFFFFYMRHLWTKPNKR